MPKQLIFGRFKEKSRRHPLIRLSRGFDAEDAYSSISGFKVYYWAVPKFRALRFTIGICPRKSLVMPPYQRGGGERRLSRHFGRSKISSARRAKPKSCIKLIFNAKTDIPKPKIKNAMHQQMPLHSILFPLL